MVAPSRNVPPIVRSLGRNISLLAPPAIKGGLEELFRYVGERGIPLYVLIDEYDNFANTILTHEGAEAYHSFTHGGGSFRSFFATLKGGTESGSLQRLFITGVSPITMDDVTSGFNIGRNLSLRAEFNHLLGFTEAEVRSEFTKAMDLEFDLSARGLGVRSQRYALVAEDASAFSLKAVPSQASEATISPERSGFERSSPPVQ